MPEFRGEARDMITGPDGAAEASVGKFTSIHHHFATFQTLVTRADLLLSKARYQQAAAYAQVAAYYAWHNHTGLFSSPRLEQILQAIGHEVRSKGDRPRSATPGGAMPKHILHVLTQALAIGGHTRLVWRWINQDPARCHSVVLTDQGRLPVPARLADAVSASHGRMHVLDKDASGLVARAQALREVALSVDQVVLHIHPHDVVPLVAFADRRDSPRVLFLNHADHVFWLGAGISNLVASVRESGLMLARGRRGIQAERSALLPIPLDVIDRPSRGRAKRDLGFSEETVLILSVATAFKYTPLSERSFLDALAPILERSGSAVLVVIGPEMSREWATGRRGIDDRVKVLGRREEIDAFYQAADIYVDSFPFASLTSLLEAGSRGVPLVSYCAHPRGAQVLCADGPALDGHLLRATRLEEFQNILSRLIEDRELREDAGDKTRTAVLTVHTGERWRQSVESAYTIAASSPYENLERAQADQPVLGELDTALNSLYVKSGLSRGLEASLAVNRRLLPLGERMLHWGRGIRRRLVSPLARFSR
jgi:glycosyltransferase involved in cell wall biosynthesis